MGQPSTTITPYDTKGLKMALGFLIEAVEDGRVGIGGGPNKYPPANHALKVIHTELILMKTSGQDITFHPPKFRHQRKKLDTTAEVIEDIEKMIEKGGEDGFWLSKTMFESLKSINKALGR